MTETYSVAAFYKFTPFADPAALQAPLRDALAACGVKGSVLLATEGVNGTICAAPPDMPAALEALRAMPGCNDLEVKLSHASEMAFRRLKVRLKREIVTLGVGELDVCATVGTYVAPEDWNALIADPDTLVVDTRNDYEVAIGTFQGAENPHTDSFRDFPAWLDAKITEEQPKQIAMFCTGGIRCEKATSYARMKGFDAVYHLKGGILKYLETVPEEDSLWRGECFVFDERVSVAHALELGSAVLCRACKHPVDAGGQTHPHYQPGISCPVCFESTTPEQKARFAERQLQVELAEARGETHIGRQP